MYPEPDYFKVIMLRGFKLLYRHLQDSKCKQLKKSLLLAVLVLICGMEEVCHPEDSSRTPVIQYIIQLSNFLKWSRYIAQYQNTYLSTRRFFALISVSNRYLAPLLVSNAVTW